MKNDLTGKSMTVIASDKTIVAMAKYHKNNGALFLIICAVLLLAVLIIMCI
jgi:hypothetical protein